MEAGPVGRQRWSDLLFLHWALPPSAVRPLVPPALALDLFGDLAWVTLIPFDIRDSRLAGMPARLGMGMLETNLRTYVVGPDGEPGIYFWSLDASSVAAVLGARLLYGLPYYPAAMSMRRDGPRRCYTSRRRVGPPAALDVSWTIGEPIGTAILGSRDHFLVERYALHVARGGTVYRARVRHRPYPLHRASVDRLFETALAAAGILSTGAPNAVHYSPGVDVEIFWRYPVAARARL